jgi:2-oxoglutarate dehydrogenase complex dehydrogenase (E1) component-like enzyme
MAASKKTSSPGALDVQINEAKCLYKKLRGELEAERKATKQLRREKSYLVQQARDEEQNRATIAIKDLRTKLHQEKLVELEEQRNSLTKKWEGEVQRVVRQKDAAIQKLEQDLLKEQNSNIAKTGAVATQQTGLSTTSARGAFDSEHINKLMDEVR